MQRVQPLDARDHALEHRPAVGVRIELDREGILVLYRPKCRAGLRLFDPRADGPDPIRGAKGAPVPGETLDLPDRGPLARGERTGGGGLDPVRGLVEGHLLDLRSQPFAVARADPKPPRAPARTAVRAASGARGTSLP